MEGVLQQIFRGEAHEQDTLGIVFVDKENGTNSPTEKLDIVILIVKAHFEYNWCVNHYVFHNKKMAIHYVDDRLVNRWMITGYNRRLIECFVNGIVLFDRNGYIYNMKEQVRNFPIEERQKKMGLEFSKLIRRFEDGKALFHSKNYLDAFNFVTHALHHQARLAVIEKGFYPEVTVWKQVKLIEPETYKLYHELIVGEETIEKRVELLLIANEFAISSKIDLGSMHLMNVLKRKRDIWSINDMMDEQELEEYYVDIELFVEYLVQKRKLEVVFTNSKDDGIYHRLYRVNLNL